MTELPKDTMLTTIDNPFNPFTQFDAWKAWDESMGYFSCSLLDRFVKSSDELSDIDQALAINQAIDIIIKLNPTGKHRKVQA